MEQHILEIKESIQVLSVKTGKLEGLIDSLFVLTKEGFDEVYRVVATKEDLRAVTERLDRIEFRQNYHGNRVENLEDKVIVLEKKAA